MKVCTNCGREIGTRDGDNLCRECDDAEDCKALARIRRREKDALMRSLGLTKVRGAMGGTYWE